MYEQLTICVIQKLSQRGHPSPEVFLVKNQCNQSNTIFLNRFK